MSPSDITTALANHAFEHLFIECLGWDRLRAHVVVRHDELSHELEGVAQSRGFAVFLCPSHRTILANRRLLRDIQRRLRKSYHEHILIHYCETPRKQVWQWATEVGNRHIQHREHPFFSDQPPPRLLERIRGLTVTFEEESGPHFPTYWREFGKRYSPTVIFSFCKVPFVCREERSPGYGGQAWRSRRISEFVELHIPLARHLSRRLDHWFAMDPDDAEQTATIGLLQAARRFDPDRGFQFSTYARHWILQACQRFGLEWGLPIHVPVHYFWTCYKLTFVEAQLIATYGKQDAREHFEECMKEAGVTLQQWRHFCIARNLSYFSEIDRRELLKLDKPDESSLVTDEDSHSPDDLKRALQSLHPRQLQIIKLRYGIGEVEHTLQEIADMLGLTRERIRQIQEIAEEKLARTLRRSDKYGEYGEEPDESEVEVVEDHQ